MKLKDKSKLYSKIYSDFIALTNELIDKVVVSPSEMYELGFIVPDNEVICDNNYADILKKHFGDKLIQEIDLATGNYIFKKAKVRNNVCYNSLSYQK